tara:strand:+ start:30982 stop:31758 length:777 start_codon:yes stop_codon:yes gene_type:complete
MQLTHYFSLVDVQARMALKSDASRYFLGYLWWVLEPLLYVGVFYVVFNVILNAQRADFLMFLMCGKLPFVWFSKSVNQASNSIVANAGLIGKIDAPKSLFPMAVVQEGLYKQSTVFLLLFCVLIASGFAPDWTWLSLAPVLLVNYLMIIACALIGAMLVCYVRDFSMLISLGMVFLMFTSGIFWDVRQLDDPLMTQLMLTWNPLAFLLDAYRQVLMYRQLPDFAHLTALAVIFSSIALMALMFMRKHSKLLAMKAINA